jgi:hypothetical protein
MISAMTVVPMVAEGQAACELMRERFWKPPAALLIVCLSGGSAGASTGAELRLGEDGRISIAHEKDIFICHFPIVLEGYWKVLTSPARKTISPIPSSTDGLRDRRRPERVRRVR